MQTLQPTVAQRHSSRNSHPAEQGVSFTGRNHRAQCSFHPAHKVPVTSSSVQDTDPLFQQAGKPRRVTGTVHFIRDLGQKEYSNQILASCPLWCLLSSPACSGSELLLHWDTMASLSKETSLCTASSQSRLLPTSHSHCMIPQGSGGAGTSGGSPGPGRPSFLWGHSPWGQCLTH